MHAALRPSCDAAVDEFFRPSFESASEADSHDEFADEMFEDVDLDDTVAPALRVPAALNMDVVHTGVESEEGDAEGLAWSLISPCSEPDSPFSARDASEFDDDDDDENDQHVTGEPECPPEPEPVSPSEAHEVKETTAFVEAMKIEEEGDDDEVASGDTDAEDVRYANSSDDDDEEVEVYSAKHLDFDERKTEVERLDSVTEAEDYDDLEDSSAASQCIDDSSDGGSVSSRTSVVTSSWRKIKSRTYSGPASLKMQLAYEQLRARARSATTHLRHSSASASSSEYVDDGDFSSDDEDCLRRSQIPERQSSFSFPSRLPAVKAVKGVKLPKGVPAFMRFRTSSSATTVSNDSFFGDMYRPSSLHSDDASSTSSSVSSTQQIQELKHMAAAGASRVAGMLNAASTEAARKLRSRTSRQGGPSLSPSNVPTQLLQVTPTASP
ncbi:hypothetical protein Poli38472_008004 [Pythium oligandrum]|uniref:Uncharacterized protein n=1 Tax=Pythium oligandrum TaxID=41045 RepID=A0A8K1CKW7_PYTOL|nr:hypothetical protein Poli38472_008004 [Pythium oligandrum]|eukprot:TMW65362.1 hypothetical protein Poli38472_008004 [Pythium oligandrum]